MKLVLIFLINILLILPGYSQPSSTKSELDPTLSALMMTCYVCHNPRIKDSNEIIAPPLVAVKYRYKLSYPTQEEFTDKMIDFVMNPTNQKAMMQGAVMKFGVMPKMPLDPDQVDQIVNYIYGNKIEEPTWFPEYFESRHGMTWEGQ